MSTSDTSVSSTLDDIIQNDRVRYERKGYGLVVASLITISFFYLGPCFARWLWPFLEGYSHSQKFAMILVPVHVLTYVFANSMMYLIYKAKHPFFERYKILNKPWPWESDPAKWRQTVKKVGLNWCINFTLGTALCLIDAWKGPKVRTDFESLPSSFELIWQIAFSMVCEDFVFYWSHRLLHHPKLFPYIHKKHHEFYNTVSIAAEYAHPIESVFGNTIPVFVGMLILGNKMHLATIALWLGMRVLETVDGHCGYEFSWSPYRLLPLSGSSDYHNFHHSMNSGNFCSFFQVWDTICGTNVEYFKWKKSQKKEEKLQKLRNEFAQGKSQKQD